MVRIGLAVRRPRGWSLADLDELDGWAIERLTRRGAEMLAEWLRAKGDDYNLQWRMSRDLGEDDHLGTLYTLLLQWPVVIDDGLPPNSLILEHWDPLTFA